MDQSGGQLDLLLLAVLADGPLHGYAVIAALRARSQGTFDLPEGTVYPALHRLEAAGTLHSSWQRIQGRKRRVYELTRAGDAARDAERMRWQRFVASIDAVVGSAPAVARDRSA
ncbi:MAG: putative PadR-like family transcriptional regulator [Actinomycetia bacterium]|nr:putative PadR-like family transcriptional regulator [Actinomycetes bacterium]